MECDLVDRHSPHSLARRGIDDLADPYPVTSRVASVFPRGTEPLRRLRGTARSPLHTGSVVEQRRDSFISIDVQEVQKIRSSAGIGCDQAAVRAEGPASEPIEAMLTPVRQAVESPLDRACDAIPDVERSCPRGIVEGKASSVAP